MLTEPSADLQIRHAAADRSILLTVHAYLAVQDLLKTFKGLDSVHRADGGNLSMQGMSELPIIRSHASEQ